MSLTMSRTRPIALALVIAAVLAAALYGVGSGVREANTRSEPAQSTLIGWPGEEASDLSDGRL